MFKEPLERLFSLFQSFVRVEIFGRFSRLRNHALKIGLLIALWLFLVAALLRYSLRSHSDPLTNASTKQTNQVLQPQTWTSLFPRNIWQIYLTPPNLSIADFEANPEQLSETLSWLAYNRDYEYTLVGDEGAEALVHQHFQGNPTFLRIFRELKNTGMKSDLLRYMILSVKGGVYTDTDTINLKPIDLWVPEEYQEHTRVVLGVEFDRLNGSIFDEDLHPDMQFCQWTIAATPRHPIFDQMVDWAVTALQNFTIARGTTFSELHANTSEVMELTGPSAWTDVVFRQLQQYQPDLLSLTDLSGLKEPRLVGDILILPIDGFGMGQRHSNSTNDGTIPTQAYVQHKFRGSWKHDKMQNQTKI
ncbi:hypothetical protein N7447_010106 [Penicillium robsamsonii]|uniref:uncharacterized protein n=1 Tax=Penicillium robsamsonii TaxID=1792511 RepID=UPI0025491FE3|nr:uncharacterized protein N7447_010106 [Penicillium robsamsonii]KAJ5813083.1 hypothetical protein N7447_010106 [Penicillium robsamsonii]